MTVYASGARIDGLFDQARAALSIEDLVGREGVKLRKAGQELRGPCALCGAGQGSKSVFAVKGDHWRCYGCGLHGDVVDLAAELRGESLVEAARWLIGREIQAGPYRPRPAKTEPEGPSKAELLAAEIWRASRPIGGTLVETYLRHRGISAAVIALAAPNLRFHPMAKHSWDERARSWVTAPAMVVQVVTAGGPTGGVHVTYLDRATGGKSVLEPAKRMWGPQLDAEGRAGGAWLIGPDGDGDLVVSEGIETGLSVATLSARAGLPQRVAAALSLGRLQGGWKRDEDGCIDPFKILSDPAQPPFTWPHLLLDRPWREVTIAVDRDMSELRVKARTGRGKICWFMLPAETRARLCGRLAVAAWKAAGAPRARAVAPPPGLDFNDHLRRVLALESAK